MTFDVVSLCWLLDNCPGLLAANFAETGLPGRAFAPARSVYEVFDRSTPSFGIVARDDASRDLHVVGYAAVLIGPQLHTSDLIAQNDAVYVVPERRGSGVGGRLFVEAEREAKRRGAGLFAWQVGKSSGFTKTLQRRTSPRNQQQIFFREL